MVNVKLPVINVRLIKYKSKSARIKYFSDNAVLHSKSPSDLMFDVAS